MHFPFAVRKMIKIYAAEPEVLSFIVHVFLFIVQTWRLHYHQSNLTTNSSVTDQR